MTELNNCFAGYLAEGNVLCGIGACDRDGVVGELVALLARNNAGLDANRIVEEVMAREKIFPTVVAPGLAVPHARFAGLERPLVALATSPKGIDFSVPEMPPVKVIVLVLTPIDDPGLHLQLLTALARDFRDPATVEQVASLSEARAVLSFFGGGKVRIPDFLRARDVMDAKIPTLFDNDTLATAIRMFAVTQAEEIPVIDNEDDLRGVLSLSDILKFALPEHILWMEDLSSVYRFQPFADALKSADDTKIADIMREEFIKVPGDVPAIQLAKLFLVHKLRQIVVVDDAGKLAGAVTLQNFASKLFWE